MRSLQDGKDGIETVLAQLEFEHAADLGLIFEIDSAFMGGSGNKAGDDVLGYLLRSLFENCKRHQCWEQAVLYPVAKEYLAKGLWRPGTPP